MNLTVAICDDNKHALNEEAEAIAKVLNDMDVKYKVHKFSNPENLLNFPTVFDIAFLDIEMKELNGIEVAKKIKAKNIDCLIIFITNYPDYLDNAFEVNAFRFWGKPLNEQKLKKGMDFAIKELNSIRQSLYVRVEKNNVEILAKNILYAYVSNKIARVVTINGEIYTYNTYSSICDQLTAMGCFAEPFRGYCVNFAYIRNFTQTKLICSYQDKSYELNVSRRKYEEFNKAFITWLGGNR